MLNILGFILEMFRQHSINSTIIIIYSQSTIYDPCSNPFRCLLRNNLKNNFNKINYNNESQLINHDVKEAVGVQTYIALKQWLFEYTNLGLFKIKQSAFLYYFESISQWCTSFANRS